MVYASFLYGAEETIGLHVILSNLFWWTSAILVAISYKKRRIWNVGEMPWAFLFLTFIFFGLRELGHIAASPVLVSSRYILGMNSAIFMASAFILLYMKICRRKTISKQLSLIGFIPAIISPIILIYLYYSGTEIGRLKDILFNIENIVWIICSSITIFTTFMIGTKSTGDFIKFFMFFQFAAIFVLLWKFLGFIGSLDCPISYSIRETLETMVGVFAVLSLFILNRMLENLSERIS